MTPCKVTGCPSKAGRYSHLCRRHRTLKRLRGAPDQRALTAGKLKPFIKIAHRYMVARPYADRFLPIFKEVWTQLLHEGTEPLRERERGHAYKRYELDAAVELEGIQTTANLEEILPLVVAIYLFREHSPNFFVSHDAFLVTLQRLVRKSSAGAYEMVWHETRQTYAKKLRGLKMRAAVALGKWMNENFAPNCGALAVEITKHINRKADRKHVVTNAILDLRDAWRSDDSAAAQLPSEQTA